MIKTSKIAIEKRLESLEKHLDQENPVLLKVVQSFRNLDRVAYRLGFLSTDESYATRVPWWPLVSVLGTFSSGKSTFINSQLGQKLQRTGNQAVDDKFTVVCYSKEDKGHTLPGLALDADPRFPFYQISQSIEEVAEGEGRRIDTYLQLKTCRSETVRNKILIDSPGFDADAQRTSTLRITDRIIDLSDLVLIFFDARHPEPGSMQDTLEHLVSGAIHRHDANKFLFVLNQIDCAAKEDNPEDVVAAWQRALATTGLTAGRFYQIYNEEAASPIDNETLANRFRAKRDEDMAEIQQRLGQVEVDRAYRIIGELEHRAKRLAGEMVPKLRSFLTSLRTRVLIGDIVLLLIFLALGVYAYIAGVLPTPETLKTSPLVSGAVIGGVVVVFIYLHSLIRRFFARRVLRKIAAEIKDSEDLEAYQLAFTKNTKPWWRSCLLVKPTGWGRRAHNRLSEILSDADQYVQKLNNLFANPSGNGKPATLSAQGGESGTSAAGRTQGAPTKEPQTTS